MKIQRAFFLIGSFVKNGPKLNHSNDLIFHSAKTQTDLFLPFIRAEVELRRA